MNYGLRGLDDNNSNPILTTAMDVIESYSVNTHQPIVIVYFTRQPCYKQSKHCPIGRRDDDQRFLELTKCVLHRLNVEAQSYKGTTTSILLLCRFDVELQKTPSLLA